MRANTDWANRVLQWKVRVLVGCMTCSYHNIRISAYNCFLFSALLILSALFVAASLLVGIKSLIFVIQGSVVEEVRNWHLAVLTSHSFTPTSCPSTISKQGCQHIETHACNKYFVKFVSVRPKSCPPGNAVSIYETTNLISNF